MAKKGTKGTKAWTGFASVAEARAAGWTEDDVLALQKRERTRAARLDTSEAGRTTFVWPCVDGKSLRPFYGALTDDEKRMYRDMRKALKEERPDLQGSRPHGKGRAVPKDYAKYEALLARARECGDAEIAAMVLELMPKREDSLLREVCGVGSLAELEGKVSWHYLMFRSPEGAFAEDTMLTPAGLLPLMEAGWTPKYTKPQVEAALDKLAARGIDLRARIA